MTKITFCAYFWYWYEKKVDILTNNEERIYLKTEKGEFEAIKNDENMKKYYILKYLPIAIFLPFFFTVNELILIDLVQLIAPLSIVILQVLKPIQKIVLPIILAFSIVLFLYIDIREYPYFIKYMLVSYALSELIIDLVTKRIFIVYKIQKDKEKEMVSFGMVSNDGEKNMRREERE